MLSFLVSTKNELVSSYFVFSTFSIKQLILIPKIIENIYIVIYFINYLSNFIPLYEKLN